MFFLIIYSNFGIVLHKNFIKILIIFFFLEKSFVKSLIIFNMVDKTVFATRSSHSLYKNYMENEHCDNLFIDPDKGTKTIVRKNICVLFKNNFFFFYSTSFLKTTTW